MKAWQLQTLHTVVEGSAPLTMVETELPEPTPGEIRLKVLACGVCHTELDEIEGRTPPGSLPIVPGHEIIGIVDKNGLDATRYQPGDRVGVGWIHSSSGDCEENLSARFVATGRDIDGGYAEYAVVDQDYAFPIPSYLADTEAAPLLCAGGVGYRALRLTGISDGDPLGFTGFGGSAHLVLQMAKTLYPNSAVYVFAREETQRAHALSLGAQWAGTIEQSPPAPLRAIIDTTPAWLPVVSALSHLSPGGRLVINAIRKEDTDKNVLLNMDYAHHLWMEKEIKTVANVTAADIRDCLLLAERAEIRPTIKTYAFDLANRALSDLKFKPFTGAKVLQIAGASSH